MSTKTPTPGRFQGRDPAGSKTTISDLKWLCETGWVDTLKAYAAAGGHLMGICGLLDTGLCASH